jgi:sulfonate transport system substrate-binding protein
MNKIFAAIVTMTLFISVSEAQAATTLRVAAGHGSNGQPVLEVAKLDDTPYKVEFHVFQGGGLVIQALTADQVDLGIGSQIPPIFAFMGQNQGNLKVIAVQKDTTLLLDLLIPAGSPIKSVADLKGKKVAYLKAAAPHYFLMKMLEDAGLGWDDIERVELSAADGLTALLTNEVDALATFGAFVTTAHTHGATTLRSAENIMTGDYYWCATPAAIADPEKHAAIADYLRRFHEGHEWARRHVDEWTAFYAPKINETKEQYYKEYTEATAQAPIRVVPVDAATIAAEQDIVDAFVKVGLLQGPIDIKSLFDLSFSEEIGAFPQYGYDSPQK